MGFWVATRWGGKILIEEVLPKPGRVFTLDCGVLRSSQDGKTITLGTLLGFGSDLEALKQTLGIQGDEVVMVAARK